MSRLAALALIVFPVSAQVAAQQAAPATAEQAIESAERAYGPPAPDEEAGCPEPEAGDEIVVCAEWDDPELHRIESPEEAEDRYAAETMYAGDPQAPDVAGQYIFRGPATVGGMCGIGLNPCPPPPAYMIDFDTLPDTPPGSDAERIGQGLAPRGDDGTPVPRAAEDDAAQDDETSAEATEPQAP